MDESGGCGDGCEYDEEDLPVLWSAAEARPGRLRLMPGGRGTAIGRWVVAGFCTVAGVVALGLIVTSSAGLVNAYGWAAGLILLVYGAAAAFGAIGAAGTLLGRRWGLRVARGLASAVCWVAGLLFALLVLTAIGAAFVPGSDVVPPAAVVGIYALGPGSVAATAFLVMRISAAELRGWHDDPNRQT